MFFVSLLRYHVLLFVFFVVHMDGLFFFFLFRNYKKEVVLAPQT